MEKVVGNDTMISGILTLIKSAITGEKYLLPDSFEFIEACQFGINHHITGMLYYGAKNCSVVIPTKLREKLLQVAGRIVIQSEQQISEAKRVFDSFEQNNIAYLPLKGIVLKHLYPSTDMRPMGDIDVLIRNSDIEKINGLMKLHNYTLHGISDHEYVWKKGKYLTFEFHKYLIPSYNKDYFAYYGDGWNLARKSKESNNKYILSNEDLYIYLFTHFAKHYRDGGIGLKHIIDLWVFSRSYPDLDFEYIHNELSTLLLLEFYNNVHSLIIAWFEDGAHTDITELIGDVIINSGAFGTRCRQLTARITKVQKSTGDVHSAKRFQVIKKVFPSLSKMRLNYHSLEKTPFLLPFFWIERWFTVLIFRRDNIKTVIQDSKLVTDELVCDYQAHLEAVGLDFNFR